MIYWETCLAFLYIKIICPRIVTVLKYIYICNLRRCCWDMASECFSSAWGCVTILALAYISVVEMFSYLRKSIM